MALLAKELVLESDKKYWKAPTSTERTHLFSLFEATISYSISLCKFFTKLLKKKTFVRMCFYLFEGVGELTKIFKHKLSLM